MPPDSLALAIDSRYAKNRRALPLRGRLLRRVAVCPRLGSPMPVMAHGLGGVRQMRLDAFAERFSSAGYRCLVFDYRHFGASAGEPRQLL